MTPAMLPTSERSAKWYHLHKWKFFYGQIELTCRFSETLKGVPYPEGLSAFEVEETCYLLILVLLHGPLRLWGMWSFTDWEGGKGLGCELLHLLGSLSRTNALSCSQRELAPSLGPLWDFSLSPQWGQLEDPGSGLHYHWMQGPYRAVIWDSWFWVEKVISQSSWPAEKEPDP